MRTQHEQWALEDCEDTWRECVVCKQEFKEWGDVRICRWCEQDGWTEELWKREQEGNNE